MEHSKLDRRNFLTRTATVAGASCAFGATSSTRGAEMPARNDQSCGCFSAPSNAEVTGVNPNELVLFAFDDYWLPFRQSLDFSLERPQLCEQNPVVRRGAEGQPDSLFASLYGTVIRQDNKFRMWYGAVDNWTEFHPGRTNMRLAYAESDDGIHWNKPKLGLREYRGSKENNLCGLDRECYNSPLVLFEPSEPDVNRRFKMAFVGYHHHGNTDQPLLCVAFSSDGLRWKEYSDNPVIHSNWSEVSGIYRWNGVYYVNGQTSWPSQTPRRTMINFASSDFLHWQQPGSISFWRHDLNQHSKFSAAGSQVHLGAAIWHRRNVLLGLYGQWQAPEGGQNPDVRINLGLIISNDGIVFREPVRDFAYIPFGAEKSEWKTIRMLQANAFINHGDKTYIWYGGASDDTGKSIAIENNAEIGLATLPRDRFGCLRPTAKDATLISQTLPAPAGPIQVGLNVQGLGETARLRVELLDASFQPIGTFSEDDGAVVKDSGLHVPVVWANQDSAIASPFRIRVAFEGERAKDIRFYGIYVSPKT